MKRILYILLGITTGVLLKPIFDRFTNVTLIWLETLAIKPSKKLLHYFKDTTLLREFISEPQEQYDCKIYYYDDLD